MNRDYTVMGQAAMDPLRSGNPVNEVQPEPASRTSLARSGHYSQQLLQMLQRPSAVAVTASGVGVHQEGICEGIAAELATSGKRVVVVPVDRLLLANPVRVIDEISLAPGISPNVWVWPSVAQQLEVFSPRALVEGENWLQRLRRTFHTVILDCPALESAPEVLEFSSIVDATILVVEAERTTRQQVRNDQLALELRGVKIAGCILVGKG